MQSGDFLQIEEAEYDVIIKPSESKKIQARKMEGEESMMRQGRVSVTSQAKKEKWKKVIEDYFL